MSVEVVYPYGLSLDSDGTTPWSRARIMANFLALNNNAVMAAYGPVASRPVASSVNNGLWWVDADTGLMSRSNGVAWVDINLTNPKPGYSEVLTSNLAASGPIALNLGTSNAFKLFLTGNIVLSFIGLNATGRVYSFQILLVQDGVGSRTVTWPATVKWPNNATPPISTGANKVDLVTLVSYDNGTTYYATITGTSFGS